MGSTLYLPPPTAEQANEVGLLGPCYQRLEYCFDVQYFDGFDGVENVSNAIIKDCTSALERARG